MHKNYWEQHWKEMEVRAYVTSSETPTPTIHGDLSSTRSMPAFSLPGKIHSRNSSFLLEREKASRDALPEVKEVLQLTGWMSPEKPLVRKLPSIDTQGRYLDDVTQRRGKLSLPELGTGSGLAMDLTQRRAQKFALDHQLRERFRYSKRYEEELRTAEKQTYTKLADLKTQRKTYRKTNSFLRAQLQQAELSVKQEQALTDVPKEFTHLFRSTTLKPRDFSKSAVSKPCLSIRDDTAELNEKKDKVLAEIFQNSKRAKEIDALVEKTRQELRALRNSQVQHYYSLLREGEDSRSEGLSWIVKALWRLGEHPLPTHFPSFLDLQIIDTIFAVAEVSREAEAIRSELETESRETKGEIIFARTHEDRWNGVQQRLQGMIKTIRVSKKSGSELSSPVNAIPLSEFTVDTLKEETRTKALEKRLKLLEDTVAVLKSSEQRRILHDCCFSKLEQRLGAPMKDMISALLGAEVVNRQISLLSKEHRNMLATLERTKTFRFVPQHRA